MNKWFFMILVPFFISFIFLTNGWKELDLGAFKISIPNEWNYKKEQGEDSFVGEIVGSNVELFFDCSNMGYASSLVNYDDDDFNSYIIRIDTTDKFIIKTVHPKTSWKGITGIYMHSRSSSFNFQMSGVNLSEQNEKLALKAFRTIIFK